MVRRSTKPDFGECKAGRATTAGLSNDNLPAGRLVRMLVPAADRDPRYLQYADDDGETFGATVQRTYTDCESGRQLTVMADYDMLTEQGAQANTQRNRRIDVLEVVAQLNKKMPIAPGTVLMTGIGAGAQILGDLGGLELQTWFHKNSGLGGRSIANGLQTNYAVQGMRASPIITAGAGVEWRGANGPFDFKAKGSVQANLSPGTALSSLKAGVGGEVGVRGIAALEANLTAGQAIARGQPLGFIQAKGMRVGYEAKLRLDALEHQGLPLKPFISVQRGGPMDDTTFTVGFTVGTGSLPWLNPRR